MHASSSDLKPYLIHYSTSQLCRYSKQCTFICTGQRRYTCLVLETIITIIIQHNNCCHLLYRFILNCIGAYMPSATYVQPSLSVWCTTVYCIQVIFACVILNGRTVCILGNSYSLFYYKCLRLQQLFGTGHCKALVQSAETL